MHTHKFTSHLTVIIFKVVKSHAKFMYKVRWFITTHVHVIH